MSAVPSRLTRWSAAIGAALALFAFAYADSWRNAFHFDDVHVVVSNPALRSLANAPGFFRSTTNVFNRLNTVNYFLYPWVIVLHTITDSAKAKLIKFFQVFAGGIIRMAFYAELVPWMNDAVFGNEANEAFKVFR